MEARCRGFPVVAPDTLEPTRKPVVTGVVGADSIASRAVLLGPGLPGIEQFTVEKQIRVRAYKRLLAVHAAIGAYRWEHNRMPDSLAELKLGDLAQDPFSAQPFQYTRLNDRNYTLASVGCVKREEDGHDVKPIPGAKPVPITLVASLPLPSGARP